MRWTYACPHCDAMLNPKETVILLARHDGIEHLVGFHPEPGNYEVYLPPGKEPAPGARWDFLCPVCRHNLVTEFSRNLCTVDIRSETEAHRVFFTRVAGDQATFVVSAEGLRETHGRDAELYAAEMAQMKYLL